MTHRVEVKFFKNREQIPSDNLDKLWDELSWQSISVDVVRNTALRSKYPNHDAFAATIPLGGLVAVPSRSQVVWRWDDNKLCTQCITYPTVLVHSPRASHGGFVMVKTSEARPDLSGLEESFCRQIGSKNDNALLMIRLAKVPHFSPEALKDDVTGEAFPYQVVRVVLLIKKQ